MLFRVEAAEAAGEDLPMSQPTHSEHPSIGQKKHQTPKPVPPTPKFTNLPEFGLRTAGCTKSKTLLALVVSWLGLARACDCDGAAASGAWGFGKKRTTENDRGTRLLRNRAMGTDVEQDSVVEAWWLGHQKRVSDNQRLGGQTSVSAAAERAK